MGSAMNAKMIVLFGLLHGCAIAFVVAMLVMLLRGDQESCPEHSDGRGGGGGQPPDRRSGPGPCGGGLPLADPRTARVRLREPLHPGERGCVRCVTVTRRTRRIRCHSERTPG
jgi:hypothetical protein